MSRFEQMYKQMNVMRRYGKNFYSLYKEYEIIKNDNFVRLSDLFCHHFDSVVVVLYARHLLLMEILLKYYSSKFADVGSFLRFIRN